MTKKIVKIIFSILCLITIGIYFWGTCIDQNQAHVNKILDLARDIKAAHSNKKQYFSKYLINKIENILVDYTVDNDMKKTIINFLQKTVNQKFDESDIQQAGDNLFKGLSGNPVLFIRDAKR